MRNPRAQTSSQLEALVHGPGVRSRSAAVESADAVNETEWCPLSSRRWTSERRRVSARAGSQIGVPGGADMANRLFGPNNSAHISKLSSRKVIRSTAQSLAEQRQPTRRQPGLEELRGAATRTTAMGLCHRASVSNLAARGVIDGAGPASGRS